MGAQRAAWLLIVPLWACNLALAQVQVVYMTDSAASVLEIPEGAQPYVVGFGREEQHEPPSKPHRTMMMRSANGTSYRCYIPDATAAAADAQPGGDAAVAEGSLLPQKTPTQLLEALAGHCFYRVEEWWTYELCYGQRLRQYHKQGGKLASQYVLGLHDEQQPQADEVQVDSSEVSGAQRYVAHRYSGGEACELTGSPRSAEVRFVCGGDDTLLTSVKEPASCSYVVTVATPRLCKHPGFQQQPVLAALIQCHPLAAEEAAAAAAARGDGPDGHCAAGARQQPDGSCASQQGAAVVRSTAAAPPGNGSGVPAAAAAAEDEDDDGRSLLQSLVEGEHEAYDEYEDPDADAEDPYLNPA